MAQTKKPYTIERRTDGTLTLRIGGISQTFANAETLLSFAQNLYAQAQDRWVGIFRLNDREDGHVDLIFNKGGAVLHMKDYEQAERFAMMIADELSETDSSNGNR